MSSSPSPEPTSYVQEIEVAQLRERMRELQAELDEARLERTRVQREMELSSNELMHVNAELQAVFTALPDLFLRVDSRGMVVDHKGGGAGASEHLLEPDPWNVPISACIVAEAADAIQSTVTELARTNAPSRVEYALGAGEQARHFEARAVRLPNMDTLVAIEEVTERARAHLALLREQEDRARELKSFAAAASHDLRAPLRNFQVIAEWIEDDIDDVDAVREHVTLLRKRVRHMDALLSGVLEYAQAGAQPVSLTERVDTQQLARAIADLVAPSDFIVAVRGLPVLNTWRVPLERVLLNLVSNAVKHHDQTSGHITIDCDVQPDFVTFCVADDGPGIPEKDRERAFSMFQKLSRRDATSGAGMGLALVRRMVQRLGGNVRIEAGAPRGLRVLVQWPTQEPDALRPCSELPPALSPEHETPTEHKEA